MKLVVMTTETPHHTYFVRELQRQVDNVTVLCETQNLQSYPFETFHPFEKDRDDFEWDRWFDGSHKKLTDFTPVRSYANINDTSAIKALHQEKPDAIIVFGTGIIKKAMIDACPPNIFNLHGGDPESYRGLDTHLWAIYHRDFTSLITTLHRIDPGLDTGNIIIQSQIPLNHGIKLHQLRAANTEVCVKLSLAAIDMYTRHGNVIERPQRSLGRYYSAMPKELKEVCLKHFSNYVSRLADADAT